MGRTWILHTETKGTGAQMVPLDSVKKRTAEATPVVVARKPRRPAKAETPAPASAHRFKVLDQVTRETLTEDASMREALDVLKEVRSPVDVNVYVWRDQPRRWRLLTLEEKRSLWDLRDA